MMTDNIDDDALVEKVARAIYMADPPGQSKDHMESVFNDTVHFGDCIGVATTCCVCLADEHRLLARAALSATPLARYRDALERVAYIKINTTKAAGIANYCREIARKALENKA